MVRIPLTPLPFTTCTIPLSCVKPHLGPWAINLGNEGGLISKTPGWRFRSCDVREGVPADSKTETCRATALDFFLLSPATNTK